LQQTAGAISATQNRKKLHYMLFLILLLGGSLGMETSQPIDLILCTCNLDNPKKDIPEYVEDLRAIMVECHKSVRSNICKAQH
jgi:hypothetical protein